MKTQTFRVCFGVAAALSLAAVVGAADSVGKSAGPDPQRVYTEAEAIQIGWPSLAGPFSNFSPAKTDVRLVEDLATATVAWTSENLGLGTGKQSTGFAKAMVTSRIETYLGPGGKTHPGSWAGVIVGEGKVFASSMRPTGPFVEVEYPDKKAKVRVDAEDLVVAVDLLTGKKLWEAAEPGSVLWGGGKRVGFQVAPVYNHGKVFTMGATGRLFAYDAANGKKLWQSDIGEMHKKASAERAQVLESLAKGKFDFPNIDSWSSALVVADGVLVVPTFIGNTIRGLNLTDGSKIWEAAGVISYRNAPSVFTSGGREYLLTANERGEMRLLNPRDGKELWKVTDLGPNYFTLAPGQTHVLVNVSKGVARGDTREPGSWGGYRISPEKAELAWKKDCKTDGYGMPIWPDTYANHQQTIRDGIGYFTTIDGAETGGGSKGSRFVMIRMDNGDIVREHQNPLGGSELSLLGGQLWYLIGDKVICRPNSTHGPHHGSRHPWSLWQVADKEIKQLPGQMDKNEFITGYEVLAQVPIVAGRMIERNETGGILCYDLRARPNSTMVKFQLSGPLQGNPKAQNLVTARVEIETNTITRLFTELPMRSSTAEVYSRVYVQGKPREITPLVAGRWKGNVDVELERDSETWQFDLDTTGATPSGTYQRIIPALAKPAAVEGVADAKEETLANTTKRWVITLQKAVCPESDGSIATRRDMYIVVTPSATGEREAFARARTMNTTTHEVQVGSFEAGEKTLTLKGAVLFHSDSFVNPSDQRSGTVAMDVDVTLTGDGKNWKGIYKGQYGSAWTGGGKIGAATGK